jgi:hypothetical protein
MRLVSSRAVYHAAHNPDWSMFPSRVVQHLSTVGEGAGHCSRRTIAMISIRPGTGVRLAHISAVDKLEYFLRSRASKVVVCALVANTMVAQLLHNSAGQLALGNQGLLGYLLISAICSTVAFALFEVSTIFHLHDLMALDVSIKAEIGAERLIKRGYFVLAVSSLINYFLVL